MKMTLIIADVSVKAHDSYV